MGQHSALPPVEWRVLYKDVTSWSNFNYLNLPSYQVRWPLLNYLIYSFYQVLNYLSLSSYQTVATHYPILNRYQVNLLNYRVISIISIVFLSCGHSFIISFSLIIKSWSIEAISLFYLLYYKDVGPP